MTEFKKKSAVIIANRMDKELEDVKDKVYNQGFIFQILIPNIFPDFFLE